MRGAAWLVTGLWKRTPHTLPSLRAFAHAGLLDRVAPPTYSTWHTQESSMAQHNVTLFQEVFSSLQQEVTAPHLYPWTLQLSKSL